MKKITALYDLRFELLHFANLVNELFIPLCIETGIEPTDYFFFKSMFRGCIPAEIILKKKIAKEVYEHSGDYLSKQQLRREKIKDLQDTLIKFIKVLDPMKKIEILRFCSTSGIVQTHFVNFINIQNGIARVDFKKVSSYIITFNQAGF